MDKSVWVNSVDPNQTAPTGTVWSGSTLFAILSIHLDTSTKDKNFKYIY